MPPPSSSPHSIPKYTGVDANPVQEHLGCSPHRATGKYFDELAEAKAEQA
jgi:hypothetical protein